MKRIFRKLHPSKETRAYNKMHRHHRRELINHAKETREWDWSFLHDSIIMQIKHMYEYYTAGNNVMQSDESSKIVIDQLNHILELAKEIENIEEENLGCEISLEDGKIKCSCPEDYEEKFKELETREHNLYKELYSYIGEYIRWWWD